MLLGVESKLNKLKSVPGVELVLESLVLVGNAWNCLDYLVRDLYFGFLDRSEDRIFGNKLTRTSK